MVTGGCSLTLYLHGNNSLKGKRSVVKRIKSQAQSKFNISISEVDEQDNHRKIILGLATVSGDKVQTERVLENAVNFIEDLHLAELLESRIEIY